MFWRANPNPKTPDGHFWILKIDRGGTHVFGDEGKSQNLGLPFLDFENRMLRGTG